MPFPFDLFLAMNIENQINQQEESARYPCRQLTYLVERDVVES